MKKVLKWIGIILGGLLVILIVAVVGLSIAGGARLNKTHDIQAEAIAIPTDEAALARGEHLVHTCESCHGPDLTGQPLIEDPAVGTVYAANITGLGATHTDADMVRAIRHAVDTDGRQLVIMPAEAFIHFSEEDLGAIIAHLKTVPKAGNDTPPPQLTFMGRVLMGAGLFGDVFPAEYIDHNQPFHTMPDIGANIEYGEYLSRFCASCHGADLTGAQPADPESPLAPNLTQSSHLASWSEADFIQTIRSGTTPEGRQLNPDYMPWKSFAKFEDDELKGLWMYLQSLSPQEVVTP
jgi:cytochrome c553